MVNEFFNFAEFCVEQIASLAYSIKQCFGCD